MATALYPNMYATGEDDKIVGGNTDLTPTPKPERQPFQSADQFGEAFGKTMGATSDLVGSAARRAVGAVASPVSDFAKGAYRGAAGQSAAPAGGPVASAANPGAMTTPASAQNADRMAGDTYSVSTKGPRGDPSNPEPAGTGANSPSTTNPDGSALPPGITRTGNSFSGGPVSGALASSQPAMTTEQANEVYGAMNAQARARDQQNELTKLNVMRAGGNTAQASYDKQQAESDARRADLHAMGQPGKASTAAAAAARARADRAGVVSMAAGEAQDKAAAGYAPIAQTDAQVSGERAARAAPGQRALVSAEASQRGAQAGLAQAETGLAGQKGELGKLELAVRGHMAQLQQAASQPGPDGDLARQHLATYNQAMQGKGGPVTPEDVAKIYGDMQSRAAAQLAIDPHALDHLPSYKDFYATMTGQQSQSQHPMEGAVVRGKVGTAYAGKTGKIVNGNFVPDAA
jgi:hypothetical protein